MFKAVLRRFHTSPSPQWEGAILEAHPSAEEDLRDHGYLPVVYGTTFGGKLICGNGDGLYADPDRAQGAAAEEMRQAGWRDTRGEAERELAEALAELEIA